MVNIIKRVFVPSMVNIIKRVLVPSMVVGIRNKTQRHLRNKQTKRKTHCAVNLISL